MPSHWCDFQNTDVILNCGSNSVENHPVSALWLEKAHEQGAKWIVVDPRYTRTAEQADIYCPIRSGTDIAFYGGMYNYIIEHLIEPNLAKYQETGNMDEYNFEYLLNYTNASYLLDPEYEFDPATGLFSGWVRRRRRIPPIAGIIRPNLKRNGTPLLRATMPGFPAKACLNSPRPRCSIPSVT